MVSIECRRSISVSNCFAKLLVEKISTPRMFWIFPKVWLIFWQWTENRSGLRRQTPRHVSLPADRSSFRKEQAPFEAKCIHEQQGDFFRVCHRRVSKGRGQAPSSPQSARTLDQSQECSAVRAGGPPWHFLPEQLVKNPGPRQAQLIPEASSKL